MIISKNFQNIEFFAGFEKRLEIWERALFMIRDFPITGVGMGAFMNVADLIYPFFLHPANTVVHAHNLFLQISVDLGLPGLISWIWIVTLIFWINIKTFRSQYDFGNISSMSIGAGFLFSTITLCILGVFDAALWGVGRAAPLIWGLWGISVATYYCLYPKNNNSNPIFQAS
jgi:putative inorganic carbon (HCO3(-)) transporter